MPKRSRNNKQHNKHIQRGGACSDYWIKQIPVDDYAAKEAQRLKDAEEAAKLAAAKLAAEEAAKLAAAKLAAEEAAKLAAAKLAAEEQAKLDAAAVQRLKDAEAAAAAAAKLAAEEQAKLDAAAVQRLKDAEAAAAAAVAAIAVAEAQLVKDAAEAAAAEAQRVKDAAEAAAKLDKEIEVAASLAAEKEKERVAAATKAAAEADAIEQAKLKKIADAAAVEAAAAAAEVTRLDTAKAEKAVAEAKRVVAAEALRVAVAEEAENAKAAAAEKAKAKQEAVEALKEVDRLKAEKEAEAQAKQEAENKAKKDKKEAEQKVYRERILKIIVYVNKIKTEITKIDKYNTNIPETIIKPANACANLYLKYVETIGIKPNLLYINSVGLQINDNNKNISLCLESITQQKKKLDALSDTLSESGKSNLASYDLARAALKTLLEDYLILIYNLFKMIVYIIDQFVLLNMVSAIYCQFCNPLHVDTPPQQLLPSLDDSAKVYAKTDYSVAEMTKHAKIDYDTMLFMKINKNIYKKTIEDAAEHNTKLNNNTFALIGSIIQMLKQINTYINDNANIVEFGVQTTIINYPDDIATVETIHKNLKILETQQKEHKYNTDHNILDKMYKDNNILFTKYMTQVSVTGGSRHKKHLSLKRNKLQTRNKQNHNSRKTHNMQKKQTRKKHNKQKSHKNNT